MQDLNKRISDIEKSLEQMTDQIERLALSLVEFKKNREDAVADGADSLIKEVSDLKKEVATITSRLGIKPNRGRNFQVRAPGPISNLNRPIRR